MEAFYQIKEKVILIHFWSTKEFERNSFGVLIHARKQTFDPLASHASSEQIFWICKIFDWIKSKSVDAKFRGKFLGDFFDENP